MKLVFEFLPIILFFIAYKMKGIFFATLVAMLASLGLLVSTYIRTRKWDLMQIITVAIILLLGSATLFFHDENIIKYKPTVVYGLMALVFYGTSRFTEKSLLQRLMGSAITLNPKAWQKLNGAWIGFFFSMAIMNTWVAMHYDTDTWVNFKLFGTLTLTLLFILAQAFYIARLQRNE